MKRLRIAVLCGGPSSEHRVSLISSRNVIAACRPDRFEVFVVGIDHEGRWRWFESGSHVAKADDPARIRLAEGGVPVALIATDRGGALHRLDGTGRVEVDVAFPVLHGRGGEDGAVQGALMLANIPTVGCGVAASAVCMDKDLTKTVLAHAGIPVVPWQTIRRRDRAALPSASIRDFGSPLFVKPANAGSSVGITKVTDPDALDAALDFAFEHDDKVLVEPAVVGRELECAVLDGDPPDASDIAEIIAPDGFYSYEAKYLSDDARLILNADLDPDLATRLRTTAVDAFNALDCAGLARVDFFATPAGDVVVNEVNTMPGFTAISMYPKLWEQRGVDTPTLIDRLVDLALQQR